MKWNFPITKTVHCHECKKPFDMVLRSKDSKKHPCPACGKVHVFDFDAAEELALEEAKKAVRKSFGGR